MPDYMAYHRSLADELHGLKNRVRDLVQHWPSDGELKEAVLRTILRRHLPPSSVIGRGFVVSDTGHSSQIDVMVVNANSPALFREGDFMIVTPDCLEAAIEVKTSLASSAELSDCAVKLAKIGEACLPARVEPPWLGIFSYEGVLRDKDVLVDAASLAERETGCCINCISYGSNRFLRYWLSNEYEPNEQHDGQRGCVWRSYRFDGLAPSYFVGNLVDAVASVDAGPASYAWFPLPGGKGPNKDAERRVGKVRR